MALPTGVIATEEINQALFWTRVDKSGPGGCWLWIGNRGTDGYGQFSGRHLRAHRVAYVLSGRQIEPGQVVDHLCRVPLCVNPQHLEATTVQVNTARGTAPTAAAARARLAGQCINGHVIAQVGLYPQHGGTTCAQCSRDRASRYRARRRQAGGRS